MTLILSKGLSIFQLIVIPYITAQQPLNERSNPGFGSSIVGSCVSITEK